MQNRKFLAKEILEFKTIKGKLVSLCTSGMVGLWHSVAPLCIVTLLVSHVARADDSPETPQSKVLAGEGTSQMASVKFPPTPEQVKYLLKYAMEGKTFLVKSLEAKFVLPIQAQIIGLTAVRPNGTIAREYSIAPLMAQLASPNLSDDPTQNAQSEPEEIDSGLLSSYEDTASNSETRSSEKIALDEQNDIRRGEIQGSLGLKLIRFNLESTLGAQSLKGSSFLLSPTYELAQSFFSGNTPWAVGIGGTFAKLVLNQPSQKATGTFSKTYLFASGLLAPKFTFKAALNFLKTPELSEVIQEIDGTEQAKISSYSRISPTFRGDYLAQEELDLGLEIRPYVSGGGGFGYSLDGTYLVWEMQRIKAFAGAEFDAYNLKRSKQCSDCTDENSTKINQLSIFVQGQTTF